MKKDFHGWNCRAVVCILALALSLPALSAGAVKQAASLADAVEQAWQLHPLAAGLDASDAEARAAQEMSGMLTPEPASVSLGNLNDRQGRNLGKQEWEIELAVPLWLPSQKDARSAEADSRSAEAVARRAAVRLDVAGEVSETWWTLAAARSTNTLAARRLDTARALDSIVQKRFEVGELSRIDANLAQGEVLAAEAEMIESEAALLQAEHALRTLTGTAPPPVIVDEAPAMQGISSGVLVTPENHPLLIVAAAAARSAHARVRVANESRRTAPELALRVVRERSDFAEPYASTVGIRLKIPFSSAAQVRRDESAAQVEADMADAGMLRIQTRVRLEAERAQRALQSAERQLVMAQERLALSAENLRLGEMAFSLGESDLATLLRIRAAAFDSEFFLARQRVVRAAAISRLNQAMGVLP